MRHRGYCERMSETKSITLNGDPHRTSAATIADLVRELGLAPEKVAVEHNATIVPRSTLEQVALDAGDTLEIVHFVGGGDHADSWTVAGRTFTSRLIVGTGKYKDFEQNAAAVAATLFPERTAFGLQDASAVWSHSQMLLDRIPMGDVQCIPKCHHHRAIILYPQR